jgi:hypothetical protein
MRHFTVTIRTLTDSVTSLALSASSMAAYMAAADAQGDAVCGITVTLVGEQ